jgi:hypothetical protein
MSINDFSARKRLIINLVIVPLIITLVDVRSYALPLTEDKPEVRNVTLEIREDVAVITFDLIAQSGETYDITAALIKQGDPTFRILVNSATGDIGRGKFAGTNRRILWEWRKDLPSDFAGGSEYSIEITATAVGGGGAGWLYYVLGGAVVAGGVIVLAGGKKSGGGDQQSVVSVGLPPPPGKPF